MNKKEIEVDKYKFEMEPQRTRFFAYIVLVVGLFVESINRFRDVNEISGWVLFFLVSFVFLTLFTLTKMLNFEYKIQKIYKELLE